MVLSAAACLANCYKESMWGELKCVGLLKCTLFGSICRTLCRYGMNSFVVVGQMDGPVETQGQPHSATYITIFEPV